MCHITDITIPLSSTRKIRFSGVTSFTPGKLVANGKFIVSIVHRSAANVSNPQKVNEKIDFDK